MAVVRWELERVGRVELELVKAGRVGMVWEKVLGLLLLTWLMLVWNPIWNDDKPLVVDILGELPWGGLGKRLLFC